MGKTSKFNIGRIKIVRIFFRCGNEKMLKIHSGENAVSEVGRRVSWVAPASTSNLTGYPGDLKFPGRCDSFYPNFLQFGNQDLGFCLSIGWQTCIFVTSLWPGWRYPAWKWPRPGSWRGGEQPGRWSPGGWRSCGRRDQFSSTSRFPFQTSLHLVDVRDTWREA